MPLARFLPFTSPRTLSGEEFRAEIHAMRRKRNAEAIARFNQMLLEAKARQRARDAADDDAAFFAGLAKANGYLRTEGNQ